MNTTEQTSDPTLWRYPSLWSANRTIHLRNLEAKVAELEGEVSRLGADVETCKLENSRLASKLPTMAQAMVYQSLLMKYKSVEPQMEEARWLLSETVGQMWNSTKDWLDRRDAFLSAHTPTGKEK